MNIKSKLNKILFEEEFSGNSLWINGKPLILLKDKFQCDIQKNAMGTANHYQFLPDEEDLANKLLSDGYRNILRLSENKAKYRKPDAPSYSVTSLEINPDSFKNLGYIHKNKNGEVILFSPNFEFNITSSSYIRNIYHCYYTVKQKVTGIEARGLQETINTLEILASTDINYNFYVDLYNWNNAETPNFTDPMEAAKYLYSKLD